ncbi:MAG TPA: hypothetical protein VFO86_07450, partial [Terriglobia bacterium]|nr:hypothetical protein [Terriglobia bacterium]
MNDAPIEVMDRRTWLQRLIYARFIVFLVFIPISLSIRTIKIERAGDMQLLLVVVAVLTICWWTILQRNKSYTVQAYAQIMVDLLLITWT